MNKTTFDGYVKAASSQTHPLQTNLEFVFTDFQPNSNKHGIPRAEAENIIRTGINMPVKIHLNRGRVRGHAGAIPVGPIVEMYEKDDRIIGRAVVWKDEFGDVTDYLEKAAASDDGVQFSWELYYKDAVEDQGGISWLSDCVVAGAAIVADPAYAGRTYMLSLAEEDAANRINELEQKVEELQAAQNKGSQSMEPIEELRQIVQDLTQQVQGLTAKLNESAATEPSETPASENQEEVSQELAELRQFKADVEQKEARAELLKTRRAASKELISDDEFASKADFFASLSEDQFAAYVETLGSVVAKAKASASNRSHSSIIPEPLTGGTGGSQITIADLAKDLRSVRVRGN